MINNFVEYLGNNIYFIRDYRIMLDEDLARIYGVKTKVLNQSIRRNIKRFPVDFMFQLSDKEYSSLKSQIVTSKRGGRRKKPFVFTEHGAVMLASVLKSERAVKMSIEVVKAFVQIRRSISSHEDVIKQLSEIRNYVLKRSNKTDREFKKLWNAFENLSSEDNDEQIGFRLDDEL